MHNGCGLDVHSVWARPRSLAATDGVTGCFPFLEVLRCFRSLGWPPEPMDSARDRRGLPGGVAPFGDPRIRLLPTTRGLSQVAASFFASRCQGIRHALLLAWPKKTWLGRPPSLRLAQKKRKPSTLNRYSDDRVSRLRRLVSIPQRLPSHSTVK